MQVDSPARIREPRHHRSQRHRQDHSGERPAVHRRRGPSLRQDRRRQHGHRFRPRGGRARNLDRPRRLPPALAAAQGQSARLHPATASSSRRPGRRCASPTPRSSASAPSPAPRSTPRRSGKPRPSSSCRSFCISTRWIASGRTSDAVSRACRRPSVARSLPVQLPIGAEKDFVGVIDLVRLKAYRFERDGSGKGKEVPIPPELATDAAEARTRLVEAVAESRRSTCSRSSSRRAPSRQPISRPACRRGDRQPQDLSG